VGGSSLNFEEECLQDPEIRREYEALRPEYDQVAAAVMRRLRGDLPVYRFTQSDGQPKGDPGRFGYCRALDGTPNPKTYRLLAVRGDSVVLDEDPGLESFRAEITSFRGTNLVGVMVSAWDEVL